jgi:hypothetical protein
MTLSIRDVIVKRYLLPFHLTVKLPVATSYRTVLLHTKLVLPWRYCSTCSRTELFQTKLATTVTRLHNHDYYVRGINKNAVYKDSPHTFLQLIEVIAVSSWTSFLWVDCLCKQDKMLGYVSASTSGPFPTSISTYVRNCICTNIRGFFNRIIVCARYTGVFYWLCT